MNSNLNFRVLNQNKQVLFNFINVACYGSYINSDKSDDALNHIVTVYIPGANVKRSIIPKQTIGKFQLDVVPYGNFTVEDKHLDFVSSQDTLKYLEYFNGRNFSYDVEYKEVPLREALTLFNSSVGEGVNVIGLDKPYPYVQVDINLNQFKTFAEAKNALFFIRNSNYTCNSFMVKVFNDYSKYIGNLDPYYLLQFSEFLYSITKHTTYEYNFFNRSYCNVNNEEVKYLRPMDSTEYWELFKADSGRNIDNIVKSLFVKKTLTKETMAVLSILYSTILQSLVFGTEPSERDIKFFKKYLIAFSAEFLLTSKKYYFLKASLNG